LLLATLHSRDEGVCIIALRALAQLGGVDETVVAKLDSVVDGSIAVSDALRSATVEAFAYAVPSARPAATRVVTSALSRVGVTADDERFTSRHIVALARAAMLLAPEDAREAIRSLAGKSANPLAGQLTAIASGG
jgi:hypothetical protein